MNGKLKLFYVRTLLSTRLSNTLIDYMYKAYIHISHSALIRE